MTLSELLKKFSQVTMVGVLRPDQPTSSIEWDYADEWQETHGDKTIEDYRHLTDQNVLVIKFIGGQL